MPQRCDASSFRSSLSQVGQDRLVYLILAEYCLILTEAQAPQPDHNVHDGAHNRGWRAS